jgi:hypothetical protein
MSLYTLLATTLSVSHMWKHMQLLVWVYAKEGKHIVFVVVGLRGHHLE